MSTAAEWIVGYARQADADLKSYTALQGKPDVAECHRLLFLQMTCENLCKAHLIASGTPFPALQTSHGYVAGPLPVIVRQQIVLLRQDVRGMGGVLEATRHLAREIELLNPAVDRGGTRPDNCEYPWDDAGGTLRSPLTWSFLPSRMLTERNGRTFLKLLRVAIDRLL